MFIYLFAIAFFWSLLLGANDFGNLQELDFQDLEQQPGESKASDSWPFCSNMLSLSSIHIGLHALILYLSLEL
jgi:hypothetical protein